MGEYPTGDNCETPGQDLGDCDTDQPMPVPGDGDCWAELMAAMGAEHPLYDDAGARRALGIARYGGPLQRNNGRSIERDIHEERLDLAVYLWAGGRHRAALGLLDASWLDRLERP